VVTDAEVSALHALARRLKVPLIIDSAYGAPFPDILFESVVPVWDEDVVLCMSLSKLGLPGVRTGIVIASEETIQAVSSINAIVTLANGNLGPALMQPLVASGELIDLCQAVIKPWYRSRAEQALEWFRSALAGLEYYIHKPEGAIFLWLWFPDLPISSQTLYERLKHRNVVVVSGHHFFPGLVEPWRHAHECIRVTYSQAAEVVRGGIAIIAEEVRRAYAEAGSPRTSVA
jgi:valine--pyruvate aminotransferase